MAGFSVVVGLRAPRPPRVVFVIGVVSFNKFSVTSQGQENFSLAGRGENTRGT
jgi:hypothetical protein